jgi:diaminopropionate ammonia-lyase
LTAAAHLSARVNPFFTPGVFPAAPLEEVRAFHRSLPGYAPTPLIELPGLAASLGLGSLYLKDEGRRFGLEAFKALGASWALHRIRQGRSGPMTVSTATDGNHGRAVAWAARQLGLPAVIFIPAHAAPARVARIRSEGARVELVEGTYDDAVRRCALESDRNGWQVVADVGYEGYLDIPNQIVEGYATLFQEIDEQLEAAGLPAPNLVMVQAGVGSLLHAAVNHYRARTDQPMMVAVEPVQSDPLLASINTDDGRPAPSRGRQDSIMAGLNCGSVSLAAWPTVRRGVELFMTVSDRFAAEAMRRLARPVGGDPPVVAGESGAAGLAGLLALLEAPELRFALEFLRLGRATRLLVINTEGATDPEGYRRVVEADDSGLG